MLQGVDLEINQVTSVKDRTPSPCRPFRRERTAVSLPTVLAQGHPHDDLRSSQQCFDDYSSCKIRNMFYDLNIPYIPNDPNTLDILHFLAELGYTTVALSQSISTKVPPNQKPPALPTNIPKSITLLTRLNLTVSDPSQNPRLVALAQSYSLLAIRPTNEKSLTQACNSLDCDIISLDLSVRLPFHFKFKTLSAAISRGVRFEICYGPGVTGSGLEARRNLISNAIALQNKLLVPELLGM
ncbi:conserved hypothetical protein [Uncinocarpus reesii 1704]|uniref:Uncharacterized protein n=1 Tax=Uncinocarpus reesii (strain UAMH 1704) TaxID=336963 RepID=C4JIJ9_UNCRE|nr:uncharacterized protein UREG_01536 [Uncinocarpus reesii 1704]EEP76687.1 conserved hypothetical protein [Uncinocarpus reesii 1704]